MFRPAPMQRLSLLILERDEHQVLRGLGRLGVIHLVRTTAGPDTAPFEPPDRAAALSRCDDLVTRLEAVRRRIELEVLPEPSVEPLEITLDEADAGLRVIEARTKDLAERQQALQARWGQVAGLLEQVTSYEGLELPLDRIGQFSFLHFALGSLAPENMDELQSKLGDNVVLLTLPEREGQQRIVAVTSRKGRFSLETALEKAGFRRDTLTVAEGETSERLAVETRREHERLARELAEVTAGLKALSGELAQPVADLLHWVRGERLILEAEQTFPHTEATVLLTGWVPADDASSVRRQVQEIAGGRCVIETADTDGVPENEIPVLLRHPRLLRPFEMLVAGYGLPAYRELEPTLFVAITFLLMFGMMFGDVGHGAVLAVGGLAALWLGKSVKVRDVGVLLISGGLSSAIFGLVYGAYFGMHGWGLWREPLAMEGRGPVDFLIVALCIGVGIISLGLILNMVNRFRRGDVLGGFLDKFGVAGAVFYWGVLGLGCKFIVINDASLHWAEILLLIVLPLAVLMFREPVMYALRRRFGDGHEAAAGGHAAAAGGHQAGSMFEVFFESAVEVFETVLGYMANTISFVRLAAYAMSHAAILMATFVMAREVSKAAGDGAGGSALYVVVVILGNLVAIVLEGVVAGVQALRLEYYEFFSKFFSGSGRAFEPFRLTGKK